MEHPVNTIYFIGKLLLQNEIYLKWEKEGLVKAQHWRNWLCRVDVNCVNI